MRFRRTFPLLLAAAVALTLSGCVDASPDVVPTSTPTVKPVFATDADALAAAKKAYERGLAVTNDITSGKRPISDLSTVDTPKWYAYESTEYAAIVATREHFRGKLKYTYFVLQSRSESAQGAVRMNVYVCSDSSDVRVFNAAGKEIKKGDSDALLPEVITFTSSSSNPKELLIDKGDTWSGRDFC